MIEVLRVRGDRTVRGEIRPPQSGFTLVELLVVVGLVSILIALLMPALSRAREHAWRVACSSNLRQVGAGFIAYAQDSRGRFPAPACCIREQTEDWVYWQPGRDVGESRILRYLGNATRVLECPSGRTERQTTPPYPFSYSVNFRFTGEPGMRVFGTGWQQTPCKLDEIINSSQKILAIEEDITSINDGTWSSGDMEWRIFRTFFLSVIHDKRGEIGWQDPHYIGAHGGSGNVVFADGHCEFFPRDRLHAAGWMDPRNREGPY
jgi:prepilin-type N-terminal cleavage/methylation domain-containing protein/prepilin-type processing-associated H-X9-DG protein